MRFPRVVITAPASDEGKTIASVGIMAAFRQRGYQVQGFKVGPDYIDPGYYRLATGRVGRNLDIWMQGSSNETLWTFARGMIGADLAIIEGVMGYFDGHNPLSNESSTYHIAQVLRSPVLLVVDGQHSARSLAAVVLGFRHFSTPDLLTGVIITKIQSERHYQLLKTVIETECGLPCYGFIPYHQDLAVGHRQLGILPADENDQSVGMVEKLGSELSSQLDLDGIIKMIMDAPTLNIPKKPEVPRISNAHPVVAIAADKAFNFYYAQNLELLEELGARLVYFSPLAQENIPRDATALYLGGGFPEEFAAFLSQHRELLQTYYDRIAGGLPTLAECGGYMFLAKELVNTQGQHYSMVGIVPHTVVMHNHVQAVGYRTVTMISGIVFPAGSVFRGHEFHYSQLQFAGAEASRAYRLKGSRGESFGGYAELNVLAGYAHLYFPSNVSAVRHWLQL